MSHQYMMSTCSAGQNLLRDLKVFTQEISVIPVGSLHRLAFYVIGVDLFLATPTLINLRYLGPLYTSRKR